MKTRQELILDFMLALAGKADYFIYDAQRIYVIAASLADEYLENL
jgi:hypothetical protein